MGRPIRDPWLNNLPEILKQNKIPGSKLAVMATEELQKYSPGGTVSGSYISEMVQQKAFPSYHVIRAIADAIGCRVEELDQGYKAPEITPKQVVVDKAELRKISKLVKTLGSAVEDLNAE